MHIENFFDSLEGAFAPNTIRAYRSDFQHYADWCQNNQYEVFCGDGEQFTQYVLPMGEALRTATIRRRIASLSSLFTLMKKPNPTGAKTTTPKTRPCAEAGHTPHA